MSQIFISYARSTEPTARLIAETLRGVGYDVWRDDQLAPHGAYAEMIEEKLRAARAVIVVWSSDALHSQWVRAEADVARQLGTLVQVSVDGVVPPLPFNQTHCEDLTGWSGNPGAPGWRKIVGTLAELVQQEPTEDVNAPPLPDKPSIAVLPFANVGNDPERNYFVEGMTEEIVTALTRIRSLFVIASSATLSLQGTALQPQAAARRLGVRYILEGSVRHAGSKLRIAVKLTDASSNAQIWADRFEGTLEDVFALQDHVALSVAGVIEPNIRLSELRRSARAPVENLGCYDLYLRANHLRASLRKDDVIEALRILDRALALEPDFAPALAQAAGCHSQIYFNRWADDHDKHLREGLKLAERAILTCGDDATVLTQVANALLDLEGAQGANTDRARSVIERAVALNPGCAYAWFVSGVLGLQEGRGADSVDHFRRAARLDPVSTLSEIARSHIGIGLALMGRFEEAESVFRTTSYRTPRIHLALMYVYERLGQLEKSREELRLYERLTPIPAETMAAHCSRHPEVVASLSAAVTRARTV